MLEEIKKSRRGEDPKCGSSIFIGTNHRNSRPGRIFACGNSTHQIMHNWRKAKIRSSNWKPNFEYILWIQIVKKKQTLALWHLYSPIISGSTCTFGRYPHTNFRAIGPSHNLDSSTMTTKVRAAALPRLRWLHVDEEILMGQTWLRLGLCCLRTRYVMRCKDGLVTVHDQSYLKHREIHVGIHKVVKTK